MFFVRKESISGRSSETLWELLSLYAGLGRAFEICFCFFTSRFFFHGGREGDFFHGGESVPSGASDGGTRKHEDDALVPRGGARSLTRVLAIHLYCFRVLRRAVPALSGCQ